MADTTQTGLYGKMMTVFNEDPTRLWTHNEFADKFDIDVGSAQNGVFYLYRDGKVLRHIDKHPETNQFQYALEINASDAAHYSKGEAKSGRRNANLLPAQKIRRTITEIMTLLAELEDDVMGFSDEMDAKMKKIEDILR